MNKFSENPREVILETAKEIALAQGLYDINIRAVAKKCGISIGTVYNSFASKNDLLMAIIEDFWSNAFCDFDYCSCTDKSIYKKLDLLYQNLFVYLNRFIENWLEQLSLLKASEKNFGKQKENEVFIKIHRVIIRLLNEEESISPDTWTESFTKEKLAEFIFSNMLAMLRKREYDISFFMEALGRMLGNCRK